MKNFVDLKTWKLEWTAEGRHGALTSEHNSLRECWDKLDQIEDLDWHRITKINFVDAGSDEFPTIGEEHEVFEDIQH